jgi:hypothetical protein
MVGTFAAQIAAGALVQILIDQGGQLIQRGAIPPTPVHQELGHILRHVAAIVSHAR